MINVFYKLKSISDTDITNWVNKSVFELNNYINYLSLLDRKQVCNYDPSICKALYISLASCSESIVFSLYNIFALITRTEATFFDDHIKEYFKDKPGIKKDELNLLSFCWHKKMWDINSLPYSQNEGLEIINEGKLSGFKIITIYENGSESNVGSNSVTDVTCSKEYFDANQKYIISTIELLCVLLGDKKK